MKHPGRRSGNTAPYRTFRSSRYSPCSRRRSRVAQAEVCKTLYAGSIPAAASTLRRRRSTCNPARPSARSAPISNRAANHENAVTSAPAWAPGKASLKMPQSGSRCTTAKPNALEKPMTTAATGAHRLRVKTRISVPTAPAVCTLPAQNTSAVSRSKPRRKWSAPWTINATAKTTAAYRRMRSSARGGDGFARATTTLDSGSRAVRPKRRGYAGRTGREDERLDRSGAGQGKDRRVDRRHRGRRVRRGRARSGYVVLWERVTPGHGDWHDRRGT